MALDPQVSAFLELAKAANLPDISVQGPTILEDILTPNLI